LASIRWIRPLTLQKSREVTEVFHFQGLKTARRQAKNRLFGPSAGCSAVILCHLCNITIQSKWPISFGIA